MVLLVLLVLIVLAVCAAVGWYAMQPGRRVGARSHGSVGDLKDAVDDPDRD